MIPKHFLQNIPPPNEAGYLVAIDAASFRHEYDVLVRTTVMGLCRT